MNIYGPDVPVPRPHGDGARAPDRRTVSRADLLRRGVLAAGTLAAGGVFAAGVPKLAFSAPSRKQDERIFNFALELEYVKAAFYREAAERGALDDELLRLARVVGDHEEAHVGFLRRMLGAAAREEPSFDFGDATTNPDRFLRSAFLLEETTVSAYIGQGANLTKRRVASFGELTSVEARHAAWVRDLLGKNDAPLVADSAKTDDQVRATIRKTGFIKAS